MLPDSGQVSDAENFKLILAIGRFGLREIAATRLLFPKLPFSLAASRTIFASSAQPDTLATLTNSAAALSTDDVC